MYHVAKSTISVLFFQYETSLHFTPLGTDPTTLPFTGRMAQLLIFRLCWAVWELMRLWALHRMGTVGAGQALSHCKENEADIPQLQDLSFSINAVEIIISLTSKLKHLASSRHCSLHLLPNSCATEMPKQSWGKDPTSSVLYGWPHCFSWQQCSNIW